VFQDPKITVAWALFGLENAIGGLGNGGPEGRVRRQFHQLMLALERDGHPTEAARVFAAAQHLAGEAGRAER
jgi:hypothetical protein